MIEEFLRVIIWCEAIKDITKLGFKMSTCNEEAIEN